MKNNLKIYALLLGIIGLTITGCEQSEIDEVQTGEITTNFSIETNTNIQTDETRLNNVRMTSLINLNNIPVEEVLLTKFLGYRSHSRRIKHENNPDKKNVPCLCWKCFGICKIRHFSSINSDDSDDLPINATGIFTLFASDGSNYIKINMLENLEHAEPEFGIEDFMALPEESLQDTGYNSIILKEGLYEYAPQEEYIEYNGEVLTSYGYVIVNAEVH